MFSAETAKFHVKLLEIFPAFFQGTDNSEERISQLLHQFEPPLPIPPQILYGTWDPPADARDHSSLHDYNAVMRETEQVSILCNIRCDLVHPL